MRLVTVVVYSVIFQTESQLAPIDGYSKGEKPFWPFSNRTHNTQQSTKLSSLCLLLAPRYGAPLLYVLPTTLGLEDAAFHRDPRWRWV